MRKKQLEQEKHELLEIIKNEMEMEEILLGVEKTKTQSGSQLLHNQRWTTTPLKKTNEREETERGTDRGTEKQRDLELFPQEKDFKTLKMTVQTFG